MKNVWHYSSTGNKFVNDVYRRKVIHVVQYKQKTSTDYCYWTGELDDDRYFAIHVLNGIVLAIIAGTRRRT